ncbi:MAG: cobalamin-dependent protein, partial [Acidobacteriota bacterium]
MDILLTHGYFLEEDEHEREIMRPYPPLGLLYISSHLKAKGFAVEVFDSTLSSREAFVAFVERERPSLVGIYVNLITRASALEMIRVLKGLGTTVVLGGPEPANYPLEYLAGGADVIASGEGELTLEALIPHLARHGLTQLESIDGISYLNGDGELVENEARAQIPSLDEQPFPDREAIDIPAYMDIWREHHGQGPVSLITARGCPYKCRWCSHSVFGYTHRRRSPENVVREVEEIVERYDPDMLWYADDVFTIHHRWLFNYAAE